MTAPNTALTWGAGSRRTVTWNHNYGAAQLFDIFFSPDLGATWQSIASAVPAASATTGSYTVPMPPTVTTQALIRVSPSGSPGDGDVSNTPFTLAAATLSVTAPNTNVNWSIGSSRTISWSHNLGSLEAVTIDVSRDGGWSWTPIAVNVTNTANGSGSFSWTVTGPATTAAQIRVRWARRRSDCAA